MSGQYNHMLFIIHSTWPFCMGYWNKNPKNVYVPSMQGTPDRAISRLDCVDAVLSYENLARKDFLVNILLFHIEVSPQSFHIIDSSLLSIGWVNYLWLQVNDVPVLPKPLKVTTEQLS